MTTTFYAPPSAIRGSQIVLPDDEAHHAAATLRKEAGDEIVVVDGDGGWYRVRLHNVRPQQVVGQIVESRREVGEMGVPVTVGLGLLKQRSRYETFVEKAVELGVHRILPLKTERTETASFREDRVRRVMIAAMKQCGRSRLPELLAPTPLDAVWDRDARWLLCHETAAPSRTVLHVVREEVDDDPLGLLVGPEGGFTDAEVETAREEGAGVVSLGPRRLRAETAGIVAATMAMVSVESLTGPVHDASG